MRKSVMFVDDDDVFIEVVKRASSRIEQIDSVHTASNGLAALDEIERQIAQGEDLALDVIFVDINMPVMDGFDFLERFADLREKHEELRHVHPIAMLTSSERSTDRARALSLGAQEYIVKPWGLAETVDMIANCVV